MHPHKVASVSQDVLLQPIRESYRHRRGEISRRFIFRAIVQSSLGILLVVLGGIGFGFGFPKSPFVIPLHIITGLMILVSGVCLYRAGKRISSEDSVTESTKCFMIAVFVLNIIGVTFGFVTAGINGVMGLVFCLISSNGVFDLCGDNKDVNIGLSAVFIVLGVLVGIHCILILPFFCTYGPIFGIKNNQQRSRVVINNCCGDK